MFSKINLNKFTQISQDFPLNCNQISKEIKSKKSSAMISGLKSLLNQAFNGNIFKLKATRLDWKNKSLKTSENTDLKTNHEFDSMKLKVESLPIKMNLQTNTVRMKCYWNPVACF